ncbi:MAG: hypothetical protein R2857_12515 [Vampirovibrionales bacterium]
MKPATRPRLFNGVPRPLCQRPARKTIQSGHCLQGMGEGRSSRLYNRFIEKADEPIFNMINLSQSRFKLGNVVYLQANFQPPRLSAGTGQRGGRNPPVHHPDTHYRRTSLIGPSKA